MCLGNTESLLKVMNNVKSFGQTCRTKTNMPPTSVMRVYKLNTLKSLKDVLGHHLFSGSWHKLQTERQWTKLQSRRLIWAWASLQFIRTLNSLSSGEISWYLWDHLSKTKCRIYSSCSQTTPSSQHLPAAQNHCW